MWPFKKNRPSDDKWPADRPMPESLLRVIEASRGAPPTLKKGDIITGEEMRRMLGCLMLCKPFTTGHVCGQ